MKIIAIDNFDRDHVPEKEIASGLSEKDADKLTKEHNDKMHDTDQDYWVVRSEEYQPRTEL